MTIQFFDSVKGYGIFTTLVDDYFQLPVISEKMGYRTFRFIETTHSLQPMNPNDKASMIFSMFTTVLKVASYLTLVFPLLMLSIKDACRAQLEQDLKNKPVNTPPVPQPQANVPSKQQKQDEIPAVRSQDDSLFSRDQILADILAQRATKEYVKVPSGQQKQRLMRSGPPQYYPSISSGQELADILAQPETKRKAYHIDVEATEEAVIDYLNSGGEPALIGTYFYCLDLRNPTLAAHAEAIIRHAPRLVEVQGLNSQNAQALIPLLAHCENLQHIHLEIKWGEQDVDLSPLSRHSLGRVVIVGEGVSDHTLNSLKGATIEKLRLPSDLPLPTLKHAIENLKPDSLSFWNHFAGAQTEKWIKTKGYRNLMWDNGVVPMTGYPKNMKISPYLDLNIDDMNHGSPSTIQPCEQVNAWNVRDLTDALDSPLTGRREISTSEHVVLSYLKQGGDPIKVATFFRCLDLRKPTLAAHAEAILSHAPRLVEVQGLHSSNIQKLLPLIAAHCPLVRHLHIDLKLGDAAPDFKLFQKRNLGCLTLLGNGISQEIFESLQGMTIDAIYIPTIEQEDTAKALLKVQPGKIVFWHRFARGKVAQLLEMNDYRILRYSGDVGVADDYEGNKDIILTQSSE